MGEVVAKVGEVVAKVGEVAHTRGTYIKYFVRNYYFLVTVAFSLSFEKLVATTCFNTLRIGGIITLIHKIHKSCSILLETRNSYTVKPRRKVEHDIN